MNDNKTVVESDFIKDALYDKFKKDFADEVKHAMLNQKEFWIGDIGYVTCEIKNQGTKSREVIENVKFKFYPSKKFKREANNVILGK